MYLLQMLLFFLLGLILGSFYNVVGLRLPLNLSFTNNRSFCPSCKQTLKWYELIPVLSFLIQSARCLHCKKRISFIYPTIELLTGVLFAYSYIVMNMQLELITSILLMSILMIILVTDIVYMVIPNKALLPFCSLFIIMRIIVPLDPWWSAPFGAIIGFLLIMVIIFISRGGMGAGDMKLFGVLGIVLGLEKILLTFFLSCIIGSIIGFMLLGFKIITRKQAIPFGPYIILATLLSYFHGDQIIGWYYSLF